MVPSVFISYSHTDSKWKDRVLKHLRVSEQEGLWEIWDDTRIAAGSDWFREIGEALENAAVAVLLVSPDFLTSKFIRSQEVPQLLQRRATAGVRIFPIIVEPCDYEAVEWLSQMDVRPKRGKAISTRQRPQAEMELLAITKEIRAAIGSSVARIPVDRGQSRVLRKVLWVDDYPTNNEQLIKKYHERGLSIDLALDHDQAMERLKNGNYDLVISDMGRGSDKQAGLRLLRALKTLPSTPPVIVFSGVPPGDYRHDAALEEGAVLVTHDPRLLEHKIDEMLRLR